MKNIDSHLQVYTVLTHSKSENIWSFSFSSIHSFPLAFSQSYQSLILHLYWPDIQNFTVLTALNLSATLSSASSFMSVSLYTRLNSSKICCVSWDTFFKRIDASERARTVSVNSKVAKKCSMYYIKKVCKKSSMEKWEYNWKTDSCRLAGISHPGGCLTVEEGFPYQCL